MYFNCGINRLIQLVISFKFCSFSALAVLWGAGVRVVVVTGGGVRLCVGEDHYTIPS